MNRNLFSTALGLGLAMIPCLVDAQESDTEASSAPDTSISVALKQDIFFGFHGLSQVSIGLTDDLDLTFYAILWTRPGFGAGGTGGNLWTEWGAGVNFHLLDGDLTVNPQLGVLNGTLLSNSDRGLTLEGVVPNITATYGDGLLEGQVYAGIYIGARTSNDSMNNDFLHYWVSAGIVPISWLSFGVHWEHLWQTRGAGPDPEDVYQWVGPYVEAKASVGFIRFSGGVDLVPDDLSDFYQVTIGMTH